MKCGDCAAGWDNDGEKGCKGLVVSAVGLVGLVGFHEVGLDMDT